MAIGQSDGSIILKTQVDGSGLKKGLSQMTSTAVKAFAAVGVAAATATVAIVKQSVDAYAEYEQLVGGVETLFKNSSKKLIEYANNAYKTAGLSANEYMATVTSFSASLLQSLGGDTDKAADVANMALIDMSDNANKMGTSMESIQYAYQGFAKQNYTMLDNLKLGYGGTKTEMERLLADAQKLTGVEYDISNLSDVYNAIHAIQKNLGIAGTTALEAEKTISGSAASMKSAWQNLLTYMSTGGGDLDRAINNLVDSIGKYMNNIVPVVERSLLGIGTAIERIAPMLVQHIAKALIQAIPSLLNAVYQMIIGLAKGVYEGVKVLFTGGTVAVVEEQTSQIAQSVENQEALTDEVKNTEKAMKKTLAGFDDLQIISSGISEGAEDLESETIANVPATFEPAQVVGDAERVDASPYEEFFGRIMRAIQPVIDVTKNWVSTLDFSGIIVGFESLLKPIRRLAEIVQGALFWAYTNVLLPLSTWTINEFVPVWIEAFRKGLDALNKVLTPLKKGFETLFKYLQPVFDWVGDVAIIVVQKLGDIFERVGKVFEKNGGKVEKIFKKLGEIIEQVWDALEPVFTDLKNLVGKVFDFIGDTIETVLQTVIDAFDGVLSFILDVFAGDWESAWENIVKVFKDVFNGIVSICKGVVNLLIDAINVFIRGLNLIQFSLPNWDILGDWAGKEIGINIPEIPKLAQGAVIPANREFLAVLGDQKQGVNIEAPLQTIVDAFNMALANNGGYNANKTEVVLELDGREFGRAVVEQGNKESRRIGTRLVIA